MKVVIGLETHVQLNSQSKLLCGCRNPVNLEKDPPPNTLVCPTCIGLPGSKPRVNESVLWGALKVALALDCKVSKEMFFSRKSYFYPDMSKNFQITQYEIPLAEEGSLLVNGKKIRIRRIHIEEDPSRLVHKGGLGGETLADYNRAGTPLIEIVTEPDFSSSKEARLYLQKLALILEYLGVYNSASRAIIKSDANISLQGGARIEVKNITGTKEIEQALSYEIVRQSNLLKKGQSIARATRTWNPDLGVTQELRGKEEAEEYGFITEPDLTKIEIPKRLLNTITKQLPELPDQKFQRFLKAYTLPPKIAESLTSDRDLAILFEKVAKKIEPQIVGSWLAGYVKKTLNYHDISLRQAGIKEEWISYLLKLFRQRKITDRNAEMTIRKMVEERRHPKKIVTRYNYLVKRFDIDLTLRKILEKNPRAAEDYKKGEKKALHFLIGQGMRETQGSVDANTLRKSLLKLLRK